MSATETQLTVDSDTIARVLGRAHREAQSYDDPSEARTILLLAHSFADELAADPEFDRVRFVHTVTESPWEST